MIKFFGYNKCQTCRKAQQWLDSHNVSYESIDITEEPPNLKQLKAAISDGDYELKHLFNTSGQLYRSMKIKEKLSGMSDSEALELLSKHGKMIKRPFVTDGRKTTVGFKEDIFNQVWI